MNRELFVPLEGFDEFGVPLPGTTTADLSYRWRGRSVDGFHAILAVVKGSISGLFKKQNRTFTIEIVNDSPHLIEIDRSGLPGETSSPSPLTAIARSETENVEVTSIREYPERKLGTLPSTITIRVLYLFTNQARIDAGGHPEIVSDDNDIQALIQGTILDANLTFLQSQVDVTIEVAGIGRLDGFIPTGDERADLRALASDANIMAARNGTAADVVSILLRKGTFGGLVPVCGQTITQRPECIDPGEDPLPGCNPGLSFSEFAYHFSAVNCTRAGLAGVHELVHNMGGEHEPGGAITEDLSVFPFSFGFFINELVGGISVRFGTIMSISQGFNDEDLYLSHSNILHGVFGVPVGVAGQTENARTVELLAPAMEGFRGPPSPVIFVDGFEVGGSDAWSSKVP